MKIKVTLLTENEKPVSVLGENPEEKARKAWELVCAMLNMQGEDKIQLENVEILE